jgi:hypothetical protein
MDGLSITGVVWCQSGQRLTIDELRHCLSQDSGFQAWDCDEELILSPAIHASGLKFATDSKYVHKLLVIHLLTQDNTGHTTHRGVMDEMRTMNAIAANGVMNVADGDDLLLRQCMEHYGDSQLFKAYYSLHPVARCRLEQVHTDYITARTEAERLGGKLISSWVNPDVSQATIDEGMLAFPSVFAGGKVDAGDMQTAVDIITGSTSIGYTMILLCQIGSHVASALMDANTSSRVEDGKLAQVLADSLGIKRGMGSSILKGMLWNNGVRVIQSKDGRCFVTGAYQ